MLTLFDIDGVLVDISHRLRYLKTKDYNRFYSAEELSKDKLIDAGVDLLGVLKNEDVFFITGRPERCREETEKLLRNISKKIGSHFSGDMLYMRADGDYRQSAIVKPELIERLMAALKDNPFYDNTHGIFIDDMPENVRAVRRKFPELAGIIFDANEARKEGKVFIF